MWWFSAHGALTVRGPMRRRLLGAALGLAPLLLTGCGFHLRGRADLPFDSLFVGVAENSAFGAELKRSIEATSNTRIVDRPERAQAIFSVMAEVREKTILSLNSAGRVREFQLTYRLTFRVHDAAGKDFIPLNDIVLLRDFSFNDTQVLAKEAEEGLLYRDMQSDMVQQVLRRLTAVKV